MSERLELVDRDYTFQIVWFLDGDEGATLGDSTYTAADLEKASPDDRDHVLATITASRTDGVQHGARGYFWDTQKAALAALRAVRAAIRNDTGAPWPEWTVKALAAGWKPPKGWKP